MNLSLKTYNNEIKDTLGLFVLQALNFVAPLFVWPYLMIVLGAEQFGLIGFGVSLSQFFMIVVDYGFNLTATKEIALAKSDKNKISKIFINTLIAKILLLLLSFIVLVLISSLPQYNAYASTNYILFFMVVGHCFSFLWLFQGLGKIRQVSIVTCISRIIILPLTFIFVKQPTDVYIAAGIQALTYIAAAIVIIILIAAQHLVSFSQIKIDIRDSIIALRNSTPVFISSIMSSVYTMLFVVILGYFSTQQQVGLYSAVEKIMRCGCYLFLMPVLQVFFPRISQIGKTDKKKAFSLINYITLIISAVMILYGVCLFFFSDEIMMLLGKSYEGSEKIFQIMAFIPLMISLSGIAGQLGLIAVADNKEKRMYMYVYTISAIIALVIIFALSPILNALLTATSLLVIEFIVAAMMLFIYLKYRKANA